jgi:hypothetical protein
MIVAYRFLFLFDCSVPSRELPTIPFESHDRREPSQPGASPCPANLAVHRKLNRR